MSTNTALRRIPMWLFVASVPVATLIAVFATGFGSSGATGGAAQAAAAAPGTVVIENFSFSPKRVSVGAGSTITVENEDQTAHTFTADDQAFDTGTLGGGRTSELTVERAGTYAYHCEIHPFMTGTLRVVP
jgi:plastocyanin